MSNTRYDAYGNEFYISEQDFNLTQVDKKIHDKKFETKATTFGKDALRRFCKNKSSVVGAIIIAILMLLSFILPVVTPYNIDPTKPNVKEKEMLPKLTEYKPTGVLDNDIANNPNDWNTTWNGTQIITNAMYDPELKLPYNISSEGNIIPYPAAAVKDLDYYGYYTNSTAKRSTGGLFIFRANKYDRNAVKNTVDLRIEQLLDYRSDENFILELKLDTSSLVANDDFKNDIAATTKGEFRIVLRYNNGDKTLVLRDWSKDHKVEPINVSEIMAANNVHTAKKAQIVIEMKNSTTGIAYMAIKSLFLKTDSDEMYAADKFKPIVFENEISKQDVLRMMSMSDDQTDPNYDDAAQKLRYAKLNTGVFPLNYWRTNGDKLLYHAYVYLCDFVLDTYEYTYGVRETKDVTPQKMKEYVDKGWCEFSYTPNEDDTYSHTFKLTEEGKKYCPVVNVKKVELALVPGTTEGEMIESIQYTCDVIMYKFLGYEKVPQYLLGTDKDGFDIIVISFNGLKKSFLVSIIISAICLSFGLVWGSISGYFGGNVDLFMERFCEILSGVPSTVVITLVVLLLGDNILTFGLALCMTGWLGIAGRTRTQFYRFKGREYILASRTLGSSDMRLIFKHILPNSLGTIVTSSVLSIPSVIFSEASLSYLGILKGASSFGSVLSENQEYISSRPMLIVLPSIIISLIMISFNLFGNGLRDALNPSLKGSE